MIMKLLIVLLIATVTNCLPLDNPWESVTLPEGLGLCVDDLEIRALSKRAIGTNEPGFQYLFVDANGQISDTRGERGTQIEIAGSPNTQQEAVKVAAHTIKLMTAHMPSDIFYETAYNTGVGVFAADEKVTVYPEYYYLINDACSDSCDGSCAMYCTAWGGRREDIVGMSAWRTAIREDNVLCTDTDPFGKNENILVHEFTHAVHSHGITKSGNISVEISYAYQAAKADQTWDLTVYAMSNEQEYLAEAALTFFGVNQARSDKTGEMNQCGDHTCKTEAEGRENLRTKDPVLFKALSYMFTGNHPEIPSGLTTCPDSSILVG